MRAGRWLNGITNRGVFNFSHESFAGKNQLWASFGAPEEVSYYPPGGILQYVVRQMLRA